MTDLSSKAWSDRYKNSDTPWDLSSPTPEFVRLLEEKVVPKKGKVLVPGGGRGHDAILFSKQGFDVDLVDFAPSAIEEALRLASEQKAVVYAYCRDFFDLPTVGYHQASYDLLLEYTFFCAISPENRKRYAKTAFDLLKPGALFLGLFFPTSTDKAGPPFKVSREEIEEIFSPYFDLKFEEPVRSVKPREGREFLGIFRRKA